MFRRLNAFALIQMSDEKVNGRGAIAGVGHPSREPFPVGALCSF